MNTITRNTLIATVLLGALACTTGPNASARDHDRDREDDRHEHNDRDYHDSRDHRGFKFGVGLNFGSDRYWVDGHYEVRTETVLTSAAHDEQQSDGTVISIPASYETREAKVWVPGYWAYR